MLRTAASQIRPPNLMYIQCSFLTPENGPKQTKFHVIAYALFTNANDECNDDRADNQMGDKIKREISSPCACASRPVVMDERDY